MLSNERMRSLPSFTISRILNILKEKKTRQKQEQKQKNSFQYLHSFHCFVPAKPQTLTTTVITKLNNSNIIENK